MVFHNAFLQNQNHSLGKHSLKRKANYSRINKFLRIRNQILIRKNFLIEEINDLEDQNKIRRSKIKYRLFKTIKIILLANSLQR